jgi:hypothetical protein
MTSCRDARLNCFFRMKQLYPPFPMTLVV